MRARLLHHLSEAMNIHGLDAVAWCGPRRRAPLRSCRGPPGPAPSPHRVLSSLPSTSTPSTSTGSQSDPGYRRPSSPGRTCDRGSYGRFLSITCSRKAGAHPGGLPWAAPTPMHSQLRTNAGAACAPRPALIPAPACLYFMHGPALVDQAWRTGIADAESRAGRRAYPDRCRGTLDVVAGGAFARAPCRCPPPQSRNGRS